MKLVSPEEFVYLSHGECAEIDGVDDAEELDTTRSALNTLGQLNFIVYNSVNRPKTVVSSSTNQKVSQSTTKPVTDSAIMRLMNHLVFQSVTRLLTHFLCHAVTYSICQLSGYSAIQIRVGEY